MTTSASHGSLPLILLSAAALALLSPGLAGGADPGIDSSSAAALTWCVGDYDLHHAGAPYYPQFHSGIGAAANAAAAASDRTAVAGTPPDAILAQCRPDAPAGECSRCLGVLGAGILGGTACRAGGARSGVCLLRYDVDADFSGFDPDERTVAVYGGGDGARPQLPPGGLQITKDVVGDMLDKVAASAAAANGSRTVAGIADYPGGGAAVYGLAQCIPQLSAPDCSRCLSGALFRFSEQFNSSAAGMQVLRPSCMLQYNSSLFFNTSSSPPSLLPVIRVRIPNNQTATNVSSSSSPPSSSKHGALKVWLGAGVGVALVLAAGLTACWFIARGNRKSRSEAGSGNYRYEDLVAATCNFSEGNKLGSGGCGVVYKGLLENKQEIAVKKLTNKGLRELEREVSLVGQLQHENLVKFLGHCFQEGQMFLIYEYLTNKDLRNYFKDSDHYKKLEWPKWFTIIEGIARGLTYLHRDSGKNIIHRDLKPCNILLDSNFTAKIADFDLAREYRRTRSPESTQKNAGTYGYMAPECFWGQFSTKSDVYSYGVVVLAIVVGHSVEKFDTEDSTNLVEYVWSQWNDGRVEEKLDRYHLGIVSDEQMQQALRCVHVALLCVQKAKSRRPAMEEVVNFLNNEMHLGNPSVPGYLSPDDHGGVGYSVNGLTVSILEPR